MGAHRLQHAARGVPGGQDLGLRTAVKKIVDDWIDSDFYALEADAGRRGKVRAWTRRPGDVWRVRSAPVYILILGDTRRRAGLPMNARLPSRRAIPSSSRRSPTPSCICGWRRIALGLGAQPVSAVKNERVQGLVKHLLGLPDFIYVYELLVVGLQRHGGRSAGQADAPPGGDGAPRRPGDGEFPQR